MPHAAAAPTLYAPASPSSRTSPSSPTPAFSPVPRVADSDRRRTSASVVLRSVLEHGPVARSIIARVTGLVQVEGYVRAPRTLGPPGRFGLTDEPEPREPGAVVGHRGR